MIQTKEIEQYITELVQKYPDIESIWLFGSRANDSFSDDSDWDLLLFANKQVFDGLKKDMSLKQESIKLNIDLLVVYNDENFSEPWDQPIGERHSPKSGSLKTWKWGIISSYEAQYESNKWLSKEQWIESKILKAYRIWPTK